jgi:hypothetical protein
MGGAGRTLKVTYGSFACTLEGFEDPVATLRAITEHFQSLSSPERLFAADGPVPGADLLLPAQTATASGADRAQQPPGAVPRDRPGVPDPDADVNRLLSQTNDQMEGAEQRRRLATIGHLKAAVAATADDPGAGQGGDPGRADRYRADLARAVRPALPPLPDRTPPLVLAPELRIPIPPPEAPAPPEPAARARPDFAAFADLIGAATLPDLTEAAAAFALCVEGAANFTRPDLMRHLSALPDGRGGTPEDQMRFFGSLLRDGRILRAGQASFALPDDAPILSRARRLFG